MNEQIFILAYATPEATVPTRYATEAEANEVSDRYIVLKAESLADAIRRVKLAEWAEQQCAA